MVTDGAVAAAVLCPLLAVCLEGLWFAVGVGFRWGERVALMGVEEKCWHWGVKQCCRRHKACTVDLAGVDRNIVKLVFWSLVRDSDLELLLVRLKNFPNRFV